MKLYELTNEQQNRYDELKHIVEFVQPTSISKTEHWMQAFMSAYKLMMFEVKDIDCYYAIEQLIIDMYQNYVGSVCHHESTDKERECVDKYVRQICALIYAQRIVTEDMMVK